MARTKVPNVQRDEDDVPPTGQGAPRRFKMIAQPKAIPAEKGKSKVGVSPMDKRVRTTSETETESEEDQALVAMRKSRVPPKKQKVGKIPDSDALPFLDDDLNIGVDMPRYEKYFREKPFVPVVSVDFLAIKNDLELGLDLTDVLGRYECWLKLKDEFCPEVVRKFYCNMSMTAGKDDADTIRTQLRGREIILTKEKLNEWLGAPADSIEDLPELSPEDAQRILRQSDDVLHAEKHFQPSIMCDYYRIIHYIFSRSLINKSFNYTNLTREECVLMARIIRREKLDVGGWVFDVMKSFISRWQTRAYMPFPQIVSFILKKFNINHLHRDNKKKVDVFGRHQLKKMMIELPYDHRKGSLPPSAQEKGKKKVGTSEQESESEPVPEIGPQLAPSGQSMFPNVTEGSVAHRLGVALEALYKELREEMIRIRASYLEIMDSQAKLRSELAEAKATQEQKLEAIQHEVDDIKNIMLLYVNEKHGPSIFEEDLGSPPKETGPSEPIKELPTVSEPTTAQREPNLEHQPSASEPQLSHSSSQPTIPESSTELNQPPSSTVPHWDITSDRPPPAV